jgi:hypothetical protein
MGDGKAGRVAEWLFGDLWGGRRMVEVIRQPAEEAERLRKADAAMLEGTLRRASSAEKDARLTRAILMLAIEKAGGELRVPMELLMHLDDGGDLPKLTLHSWDDVQTHERVLRVTRES